MKQYDLSECSIVIPVEIDFPERLEHVYFQLQYFTRFFKNYKIIVIEHGKEPKIKLPSRLGIHIEFLKSEETFSTAKTSNIGAALVKTSFFCKCDADLFLHPRAIFEAFEKLKYNPNQSFIMPYNGVSFTVSNPLRKELMSSFDFNQLPFVKPEQAKEVNLPCLSLKNQYSVGLIHLFRTSVFKELGGYNENFIGWGYEDNEVNARFKILGHSVHLLKNYTAFHLRHPQKPIDQIQTAKNFVTWHFVEQMSPHDLREFIATWNRFI